MCVCARARVCSIIQRAEKEEKSSLSSSIITATVLLARSLQSVEMLQNASNYYAEKNAHI